MRVFCEGGVGLCLQWWSRVLYTSLQWSRWRCRWVSCCLLGYSLYLNIRCIVDVLILELDQAFLRNSSTLQVGWPSCDHPIKTSFSGAVKNIDSAKDCLKEMEASIKETLKELDELVRT